MRRRRDIELLREYVKMTLNEDDVGDNPAAGAGGDLVPGMVGPYGISFGDNNMLYKAFIKPFVDVASTAIGKAKELKESAKTLLRVTLQGLIANMIPGLQVNYKKIFDEEKEEVEKIKKEYSEVYNETDAALRSTDAGFFALMAFPGPVLAANAAKMAPSALAGTLSAITGGTTDKIYEKAKEFLKYAEDEILTPIGTKKDRQYSSFVRNGTVINEKDDKNEVDEAIEEVLRDPKFINAILKSSSKTRKMQKEAQTIYKETLQEIYDLAIGLFEKTKTIEDLRRSIQKMKKVPQSVKTDMNNLSQLKGKDKKNAEEMLIKTVQKSFKEYYEKNVESHVNSMKKSGVPEDSPVIKDYMKLLSKVKSMNIS